MDNGSELECGVHIESSPKTVDAGNKGYEGVATNTDKEIPLSPAANSYADPKFHEPCIANKRRKNVELETCGIRSLEDVEGDVGASLDEIFEVVNYGIGKKLSKSCRRGRKKGTRNKLDPEITRMLGTATLHCAHGSYEEAITVLNEVVRIAPHVPETYHTLGLAYNALGNTEKAMGFYTLAARLMPKDSNIWKVLYMWHNEHGDKARAVMCLLKAISGSPKDITLKHQLAHLYEELGDNERAAESFEKIVQVSPNNVEALCAAAKLYKKCGKRNKAIGTLEDYMKCYPSEVNSTVIDLLAQELIENNSHECAIKHIEHCLMVYYAEKDPPLELLTKEGICYVHLGDIEKAEAVFAVLKHANNLRHSGLIQLVADTFMDVELFSHALRYYHMLESNESADPDGHVLLKISKCYLALKERDKTIAFGYKALQKLNDSVEARLMLASLVEADEEEAIHLLAPPENLSSVSLDDTRMMWWHDTQIKLKLGRLYLDKGMLQEFVSTIKPLVLESLHIKNLRKKAKKRLTASMLRERAKILDVSESDDIFTGLKPLASRFDLAKASRAKRLLQKREEQKAFTGTSSLDSESGSDSDEYQEETRVPPLPAIFKDEEHQNLIIDLCKALQSLQRYWEALEIISITRKLASKKLPSDKIEKLHAIATYISYNTTDAEGAFDCVRGIVLQRPYSFAAWNCYHKITSRFCRSERIYSKHTKFIRHIRSKINDCLPPILISGHQFTAASFHQDAAREYLEAYKLLPENPLINLCVGTALISLALGFRVQNKHQCIAQGLAFLYNNLRLAESNELILQEALYNIARAYHHVGMVSLAAACYEKVLEICVEDYPVPRLLNENSCIPDHVTPGHCNLHREAAYNLHLIYKQSGAFGLARQVLIDHCVI